jgi:hypothetical protein
VSTASLEKYRPVGAVASARKAAPRLPGSREEAGRGVAPRSGPRRAVGGPFVAAPGLRDIRGCTVDATVPAPIRVTERGIAVILIGGLLLLVSALVVVGLTAARVTAPDYVLYGKSIVVER